MSIEKKVVLLHPLSREKESLFFEESTGIVHWCNGSTSDSGSASLGSSPGWTTIRDFAASKVFFLYVHNIKKALRVGPSLGGYQYSDYKLVEVLLSSEPSLERFSNSILPKRRVMPAEMYLLLRVKLLLSLSR